MHLRCLLHCCWLACLPSLHNDIPRNHCIAPVPPAAARAASWATRPCKRCSSCRRRATPMCWMCPARLRAWNPIACSPGSGKRWLCRRQVALCARMRRTLCHAGHTEQTARPYAGPVRIPGRVTAISAGKHHCMVVTVCGELLAFGRNKVGAGRSASTHFKARLQLAGALKNPFTCLPAACGQLLCHAWVGPQRQGGRRGC